MYFIKISNVGESIDFTAASISDDLNASNTRNESWNALSYKTSMLKILAYLINNIWLIFYNFNSVDR